MYAAAPADEQHIQRYLSVNCFGDHVGRSGLDARTRELLTFAMLVSLGGCDPQVKGHTAGRSRPSWPGPVETDENAVLPWDLVGCGP